MMLFEIKAPDFDYSYGGLFKVEDVAEEICMYLDDNTYLIEEHVDTVIDNTYPAVELGEHTFYASEILEKFNLKYDWFNFEIWDCIYYQIMEILETMAEGEVVDMYDFVVKCVHEEE